VTHRSAPTDVFADRLAVALRRDAARAARLAEEFGVAEAVVRRWASGDLVPHPAVCAQVARHVAR